MQRTLRLLGALFVLFLCSSCGQVEPGEQRVRVEITPPDLQNVLPAPDSDSFHLSGNFGLPNPTSPADVGCYGLFVRYPEQPPRGTCRDVNNAVVADPSEIFGLFPAAATISANIITGPGRRFFIVAFRQTLGFCPSVFTDFGPLESNLSHPILVGQATVDISQGTSEVVINAPIASGTQIQDCSGPAFNTFGGTAFSPTSISGLIAWYDPSDTSTVFSNNGCTTPAVPGSSAIGCIKDKSGNNNNAIQPSGGLQPGYNTNGTNNRNSITFDGTDDFLDMGTGVREQANGTYVVVFDNPTNYGAPVTIIGAVGADSNKMGLDASESLTGSVDVANLTGTSSGLSTGTPQLGMLAWEDTGGTINLFLNNPTTPEATTSSGIIIVASNNVYLGAQNSAGSATNFYNGRVAEVMVFNRALTATERSSIKNYIKSRWNTP